MTKRRKVCSKNKKPKHRKFYKLENSEFLKLLDVEDDEDMKNGLPLVINDKVATVLSDYIRVNKLDGYNVSVISGDLHQSADGYAKNFRYKKVLAQYGSSKWMHTNFGSGQPGLSSEVYVKNSKKIYKEEDFFEIENESNTGINF